LAELVEKIKRRKKEEAERNYVRRERSAGRALVKSRRERWEREARLVGLSLSLSLSFPSFLSLFFFFSFSLDIGRRKKRVSQKLARLLS